MNLNEGRQRVVISNVFPEIEGGRFAIKRIVGEEVTISADIFVDGHQAIAAQLLFRQQDQEWQEVPMKLLGNDRWGGQFVVRDIGIYFYTLQGWIDHFLTWQRDLQKKFKAGLDLSIDLVIGLGWIEKALEHSPTSELKEWHALLKSTKNRDKAFELATNDQLHALMRHRLPNKQWVTEYSKFLPVIVDPEKALFSAWYELFPRSTSDSEGRHGTLKDSQRLLPEVAAMGFNVIYLPPINPIGLTHRRGKNNKEAATANEPGSPWAIGAKEGGHTTIHPKLGSMNDLSDFISSANKEGLDIALDLAFQCSPDHPYLSEHPQWFRARPDGTFQYAENPPKKYEDIIPFDFETDDWKALWMELKNVTLFWIEQGIKIFRVDNPHTKPFVFWEWIIQEVKKEYPEVIFLSEAFTRPKVMYWLSKIGFDQSYTYFTWRNSKKEIIDYLSELISPEVKEYFRPNFWPNTPDILPEVLQHGGKAAFISRLILAATLSSNYGIYGPPFELMLSKALPDSEEYLDSEKYEIKKWDRNQCNTLKELITQVNRIRRENSALQQTKNLKFYEINNDQLLAYRKISFDPLNILIIVVCLDPFNRQVGKLKIPLEDLGLKGDQAYRVQELLMDRYLIWEGESQEVSLDPKEMPAAIFRIQKQPRRETDFEYF